MSGLDIEGVLSAHFVMLAELAGDGPPHEWRCQCGAKFGFSDSAIAHVVAVLREQIDGALAGARRGALLDAACDVFRASPFSAGSPVYRAELGDWLRDRAAHLSDTERAMVWHLVANVADDTTACCRRPVVDLPWRDSLTEDAERCTCPASDTERAGGCRMSERGWFADWDDEADTGEYGWQPCLETGQGHIPSFEVWFKSKADCEDFIRENVIGIGWYPGEPTTTPTPNLSTTEGES